MLIRRGATDSNCIRINASRSPPMAPQMNLTKMDILKAKVPNEVAHRRGEQKGNNDE